MGRESSGILLFNSALLACLIPLAHLADLAQDEDSNLLVSDPTGFVLRGFAGHGIQIR